MHSLLVILKKLSIRAQRFFHRFLNLPNVPSSWDFVLSFSEWYLLMSATDETKLVAIPPTAFIPIGLDGFVKMREREKEIFF